jgi:hypothetical protein
MHPSRRNVGNQGVIMPRPTIRASRKLIAFSLFLTLAAPGSTFAQDSAGEISTWQCLPEETAFAVRIPNGKAIADACVENTKLGAVMFSEKRRALVAEALRKSNSEEWAQFQKKLSDYGLTTDELLQFFAGESGYAVVVTKGSEGEPLALGLSWLEPGEELAERAYGILARAIEEQEDAERAIGREDLELADRPVMQLMLPHVSTEHEGDPEPPEGYDEMSEEEQEAAWDEAYKEWEASEVKKTSYNAVLVSTVGSRILLAHGYRKHETQDDHPDAEPLAEIFTRLLADHASGAGGFVSKYADDAGIARLAGLEGIGVLELQGDVAALMPLARATAGENEISEKVIRILGADSLGPFAMRSTLADTEWRSQFSLAVSQPRQGLLQWLDQAPLDAEPPAWVPANAITFAQFSFDLGKAYAVLKEEIMREFPEQAGQYFGMAEMQVVGFAGSSLGDVLSSLGTRHVVLNFEAPRESTGVMDEQPESTAVVWQVTDEQLWTKLMKSIAPMVTSMPGGEFTDEQGYNGIRVKSDPIEGGLFLGNGNLVMAYGPQVLETTLSALNNPPQGSGAFRGGEIYQQAIKLLEPAPSLGYKIVDGNRYGAIFRSWVMEMVKSEEEFSDEDESEGASSDTSWVKLVGELMPTEAEMQDLLGVIVNRWEVNDHGVFGESAQETPAP